MRSSQRRRLISRLVKPISIMYPQHVDERWRHLDEGSEGCKEVVGQTCMDSSSFASTLFDHVKV
jgi:hypothetical protein